MPYELDRRLVIGIASSALRTRRQIVHALGKRIRDARSARLDPGWRDRSLPEVPAQTITRSIRTVSGGCRGSANAADRPTSASPFCRGQAEPSARLYWIR